MKVYEHLSDTSRWTKDYFAKRADGSCTNSMDPKAVCWCLMGSVCYCYQGRDDYYIVMAKLRDKVGCVSAFNDTHTYDEVIVLVREMDL